LDGPRRQFGGNERFVVVRQLGAGGMGVVYEVFDRERGGSVALKTLRQLDPATLYRFKKEFRALADLTHPNLVHLFELVSLGDEWFFTMELVDGADFVEYVRARAPERWEGGWDGVTAPVARIASADPSSGTGSGPHHAVDILRLRAALRQLAQGVAALHGAGKLHRDLKPSNVLVTKDGRVVICDFGLVTEQLANRLDRSREQRVIGTAAYMSPEHAANQALTEASDWYSVGVILYRALTDRLPFEGNEKEVLHEKQVSEPPEPRRVAHGVPDDLNQLCVDLLRRLPERRPPGPTVLAQVGGALSVAPALSSLPAETVFVGRRHQLAQLGQALAQVKQGQAVAVLVHGPSGMGKTALVRHFLDRISEREPAVVLEGRCFQSESVPYKAIDHLIDALSTHLFGEDQAEVASLLPRDVQALARLFPVLRRVPAVAEPPLRSFTMPDPQELRRRAFQALRELLARLGQKYPLVVSIDDLQWGDADSAALLSRVLRPPDPPPLLLLACYRTEDAPASAFLQALRAKEGATAEMDVREVIVDALPEEEARDLACALLADTAPASADEIARESRGHPFFVHELARHATRSARFFAADAAVRPPITLTDALHVRIALLPTSARTLLALLAVAGRPVARAVASRAAGLGSEEDYAAALLRSEHLIRARGAREEGGWEIYHDCIREVALAALSAPERRALHLRLASALHALDDSQAEALVEHLMGAGEPAAAAHAAAIAADRSVQALAFNRCARLYRVALDHGDLSDRERGDLLRRLGDALANAGRGAEAASAYQAAAAGADAASALELRRRAAEQLLRSGRLEAGLDQIRDGLRVAGLRPASTPRRALASLLLGRARIRVRGLRFRERDPSQIAPEQLTKIDICWSVASTLSLVDTVRGNDFQARHLRLALSAGEPYRIARGVAMEAAYASIGGGPTRARVARLLALTDLLAERTGHPHALGLATLARGAAAFLCGHWRSALEGCTSAERRFRDQCTGVAWEIDTAQFFALGALACLGELSELRRRVPLLLDEAEERGDLYAATGLRCWRTNVAWLAADDPDEARRQVMEAQRQWSQKGFHLQHYYELLALVQIDLYAGDGRGAWRRIQERWAAFRRSLLLRVQNVRIESLGLRARCALALHDASPRLLAVAARDARRLARERMPWSQPLAQLLYAALAARARDDAAALSHLDAAATGFANADMGLHAAVARRLQGTLSGGEAGRALTYAADEWMRVHGVRNPELMSRMLAPGFGR